jgi:hypothetical protein
MKIAQQTGAQPVPSSQTQTPAPASSDLKGTAIMLILNLNLTANEIKTAAAAIDRMGPDDKLRDCPLITGATVAGDGSGNRSTAGQASSGTLH